MTITPGKGLFNASIDPKTARSDPWTYKMTPKYADPYASDADRKMAKFLISPDLQNNIIEKIASASSDKDLSRLVSSGDAQTPSRGYFDFFVQSIEEVFDDKFQIVELVGDSYAVYGLGKKPKIFNFSGMLLNTVENDWRVKFIRMFENYIGIASLSKFRSTSTNVVRRNVVTLMYDSIIADGAILRLRTSMQGGNELATPFSFMMLVTKFTTSNSYDLSDMEKSKVVGDINSSSELKNMALLEPDFPGADQFSAIKKQA